MTRDALLVVLAAWLGAAAPASAAPREWLFASLAPHGSPTGDAFAEVGRLVEQASSGAVKSKLRLGGILGDESDVVRMCVKGQIQVAAGSLGSVVAVVPELRALDTPSLFPDASAYRRWAAAVRQGTDPALQKLFARRGLVLIGVAGLGWRNIVSVRKPIRSPRDLVKLRVRSQPNELHQLIWQALGAQPKAFGLNELNSALDVDLVEAFDIPAFMLFATSLTERIRYLTLSQHVASIGVAVANAEAWRGLSPRAQATLREKIPPLFGRVTDENLALEANLVGLLSQRKVQVITPTPAELAEFRQATRSVEAHVRRTGSKQELDLLDQAQRVVRQGP